MIRSTDLIAEDEVDASAAGHRNASRLRVDDGVTVVNEHPVGRDDVNVMIGVFWPRGRITIVEFRVNLAI